MNVLINVKKIIHINMNLEKDVMLNAQKAQLKWKITI